MDNLPFSEFFSVKEYLQLSLNGGFKKQGASWLVVLSPIKAMKSCR
tara:strand:+ start:154 stop:291 length:138 start_codon:yes stop_codon:yes gene_type:complete